MSSDSSVWLQSQICVENVSLILLIDCKTIKKQKQHVPGFIFGDC